MRKKKSKLKAMDSFYEDVYCDYGEFDIGIGEVISQMEKRSAPKTKKNETKKQKKEVICEDDVDNYIDYNEVIPNISDISYEVSKVNPYSNSTLEDHYLKINKITELPKVEKKDSPKKKPTISTISSDHKINFVKKVPKENRVNIARANFQKIKVDQTMLEEPTELEPETELKLELDAESTEQSNFKVSKWLESITSSTSGGSEESFSSNLSSSYQTASENENRRYRATSKRLSNVINEANICFKPSSRSSVDSPVKAKPEKKIVKKKLVPRYEPGSYNNEFSYKPKDFPAL